MKLKVFIIILVIIGLTVCGIIVYSVFFKNYNNSFTVINEIEVEKSKYHDSGSWWGYNQKKIATIGDVTFSFYYDNSNLDNGNSSETNPFKCHFTIIFDDTLEIFGYGNTNASCNVLTDAQRNKVYYIVNEPVGGPNNGGFSWTGPGKIVVYTYDFNPATKTVTFNNKHTLTEANDDGKQRMGTAINNQGQIIISYGSYDAMLNVFIYDPINNTWVTHNQLSNPDSDSLMYNYVIIKDINNFYILAIQDTAKNGNVYYQYVKFFIYKDGLWDERIIVDYRNHPEAQNNPNMVEHKEFALIDDEIHIITHSDVLDEYKYFIWDDLELVEKNINFINKKAYWIKLVEIDNEILFIYNYEYFFRSYMEIYSLDKEEIVYRNNKFVKKAYIYINLKEDNTIQVLGICGSSDYYDQSKAMIYEITKK